MGIDPRTDGRTALGKPAEPRKDTGDPLIVGVDLRGPTRKFLVQSQRHRIHQVGAACLDDPRHFFRLALDGVCQVLQCRQQRFGETKSRAHMDRRGDHIVAALPHVDMVVGVDGLRGVAVGEVGDHLVGVHVGTGTGARLKHIHGKMLVMEAFGDRKRCGPDRVRHVRRHQSQIVICRGSRPLDQSQSTYELPRHAQSADREIVHGTLGLGAPKRVRRHFERAHAVVFDSIVACHRISLYTHASGRRSRMNGV